MREQALKERDDEYRLKMAEKDRQLPDLKEKLDEAQRKADQGSQQRTGDVLEVDLCDALQHCLPGRRVRAHPEGPEVAATCSTRCVVLDGAVAAGSCGKASARRTGATPGCRSCARTSATHKCDLAALMTETLPEESRTSMRSTRCGCHVLATVRPDGGRVAPRAHRDRDCAARAARCRLEEGPRLRLPHRPGVPRARARHRRSPCRDADVSLDTEKRAAVKQFASREQAARARARLSLAGMYGDLQGLVGPSLPTRRGPALPEPEADAAEAPQLTADDGDAAGARCTDHDDPLGNVADVSTGYPFRKKVEPEAGGDIVLVQLKDMDGAEGVSGTGTITLRNDGGKYAALPAAGRRPAVPVARVAPSGCGRQGRHPRHRRQRACTSSGRRAPGPAGVSRLVAEPPCFARYVDQQGCTRAVHPVRVESRSAGVPCAGAVARGAKQRIVAVDRLHRQERALRERLDTLTQQLVDDVTFAAADRTP